jgi:hypothetical protein
LGGGNGDGITSGEIILHNASSEAHPFILGEMEKLETRITGLEGKTGIGIGEVSTEINRHNISKTAHDDIRTISGQHEARITALENNEDAAGITGSDVDTRIKAHNDTFASHPGIKEMVADETKERLAGQYRYRFR